MLMSLDRRLCARGFDRGGTVAPQPGLERRAMYATIRIYKGNAELADKLAARGDEVRSLVGGVEGFRAYYLVRGADGTASVTVCDDQSGAEETNSIAADWLRENMPDAGGGAPEIIAGEVVLSS